MKKVFIIICALVVGMANADNVITSKEYVDGQSATLQPQIQAKNTNTVLTYPAAGTDAPGEKAIYDASATYGAQSDALVTAGAFNSAMQNALESEFVCTEWQGSVHDNAHCLLYEVRAAQPTNLLNPANIHQGSIWAINGKLSLAGESRRCYFDYIPVHAGDTVIFTSKTDTPPANSILHLYSEQNEDSWIVRLYGTGITVGTHTGYKFTIPSDGYVRGIWLSNEYTFTPDDIVEPMVEISSTPHEYVSYQVYLPQNQQ